MLRPLGLNEVLITHLGLIEEPSGEMKEVYDFLIIEHQVKYGCTKYGVGARTLVLTPIQCSLFTTTLNLFRKNITLVVMCIGPIRYSC